MLAVVGVLVVAVLLQVRHERAASRDPLTTIDPAGVHSLSVSCNSCRTRRFEKTAGHWRMLEPLVAAADDAAVDKLARIATVPVRHRHAAGELDPAKVGLAPAQATLQLDATVLTFGTTDAINGDRYVGVDGAIVLVPDRFSALLFAAPENELAKPASAKD
jgi:hypothetical protein